MMIHYEEYTGMQTGKSKTKQRPVPIQMHISPIFCEAISRHIVRLDLGNQKAHTEIPLVKVKKELQAFLGVNADICNLLRQLTSSKTEWTWNAMYQKLFGEQNQ